MICKSVSIHKAAEWVVCIGFTKNVTIPTKIHNCTSKLSSQFKQNRSFTQLFRAHSNACHWHAPKGGYFQDGNRNLEALVGRAWNATKPLLLLLSKASAGRHLWNSIMYENILTHLGAMGTAWPPRVQFPKSLKGWSIKSKVWQVLRKSPATEKSSLHLSGCSPLCTELIYLFLSLSLYLLWHLLASGTTFFQKDLSPNQVLQPPSPAPTYWVFLQRLCQQHISKYGSAVLSHLCLLLGPNKQRDKAGVNRKTDAQIQRLAWATILRSINLHQFTIATKIPNSVSCQHRNSFQIKQPLPVLLWTTENTILPHCVPTVTRYSRVHVVLKREDDRVKRCFESTFCNGLNCILKEGTPQRPALVNNRSDLPMKLIPPHVSDLHSDQSDWQFTPAAEAAQLPIISPAHNMLLSSSREIWNVHSPAVLTFPMQIP